jgi:hypothetical protein
MKLSGEQFKDIISQLKADKAPTGADKRREPRVGVRAQGVVTSVALDDKVARQSPVTIRDLSPAGICVLTVAAMQRGARFILQLPRFQQPPLQAHYEVRYSKPLTRNMYAIGANLVNVVDSAAKAA